MDRAQRLDSAVLGRQKFMNVAIAEGNSPMQEFFAGATIFVTGGAGFMGKQIIEKLIRACKLKKIIVLLRPKKGKNVQERLEFMLSDSAYDSVRQKKPDFENILEAVEGDIAKLSLGLSDENYKKITEEVDFIIHLAATIRFDAPLRNATLVNVRGTRECIKLAKACKKLQCLTHVSTAFTFATRDRVKTEIREVFYACPKNPDRIIELAEDIYSGKLDEECSEIMKNWPNTYTFTKAIAEELIRTTTGDIPVCIVRPPQVTPAFVEPSPGWTDNSVLFGPVGTLAGIGLGVLHVLPVDKHVNLNMVPVDYVNNGIISATWDTCQRRKNGVLKDIPILAISSTKRNYTWDLMGAVLRTYASKRLASPLLVWYGFLFEVTNSFLYWLLTWLLHYIPAYAADGVCKVFGIKIKGITSFSKLYHKIYEQSPMFTYFLNNEWYFRDENLMNMITRMSYKDRVIFNCDIHTIDYALLIQVAFIGIRKFVLKDGLKDTNKAYAKFNRLFYANLLVTILYASAIYYVLYIFYSVIKLFIFRYIVFLI